MITINIARGNVDSSQSEDLEGLHLFDVDITRDDGTCKNRSNTSITVRPLLLLTTGAPGHIEPPWGGDWVSERVQAMMSALNARMNSLPEFYGEKVVIRIAEQPWFNNSNSEDHNTEDRMPMQRVLWEFVERLEVWEPTMGPMEVSVVQILATGTPKLLSQDGEGNKVADQETEGQRRVLVLSYRAPGPSTHASELSRPVSRTILQAIGDSENVILVRPGPFRALKTELESHPKGYFTAIYLDMLLVHKRPRKSEPGTHRIYFQFVNQNKSEEIEEGLKAVDKVAALLLLHGVQDVFIAPCPHARIHTFAWKAAAAIDLWNGWYWQDGSFGSFMYMLEYNKDNMLQQLQSHFVPNSFQDSDSSSLYEHFESHNCLIIIDGLDSANFNRQQGQFVNLTPKLSKSGALVILASRKRNNSVSVDPEFRSRVIDDDIPSSPETTARIKKQEERDCLEAVVEMTSDSEDQSEQPSGRTRLEGVYESLRSMDSGDGFLSILLAPFMGVLPSKDLLTIFCIWSTRVAKVLRKAASQRLMHVILDSDASYRDSAKLTEEARVSIKTLLNADKVDGFKEDLALSDSSVLFYKTITGNR
ncbi:hypothetical protein FPCIR_13638 [Fusarium pseudocircinatum]|uniref:Uncharacterized protein n=1 Tax=Fusarium pseudocircinatum TaxID=56676 RepID=A0A8H5KL34_9HYPO|nr:hypothetical protein FPCIR_13638 [Fusarium pseudocircinatum]